MTMQLVDTITFLAAMKAARLTQTTLAARCGTSQTTVSDIARGLVPTPEMQSRLAKALRQPVGGLFPHVRHELIRAA